MSLGRSASGPGGLSINTGTANTFGTPSSQPVASGGLFGSSSATPAKTSGASGATTMATAGGGLFGSSQAKTGTGLFGQTGTTTGSTGGGLFGSGTTTQQTQNTGGGGLFGSTAGTTGQQPQQQQQQQQQQAQQPQTGGGLFGSSTSQQQPQQTSTFGSSLFGNAQSNQAQQQSSGGLFGGTAASTTGQQTTGGGLFSQSQQKPAGGLFSQSQTQQTQPAQVAAVQINYDNLRPRSRFDDLAQPVQQEIALIDKGIQRVIKMKDEIGEFMPQHKEDVAQLGRDVKFVESKFRAVQVVLDRDIQSVKALQDTTRKNITDAQLSFKAVDNLKLPTHYHQTGLFAGASPGAGGNAGGSGSGASGDASSTHANAQDLITYFNRVCDNVEKYKKRLDEYRGEIERDMPGVENGLYEQIRAFRDRNGAGDGGGASAVQDRLGQVLLALRETGQTIVAQAGQIADTRERLSRLQAGIVDSGVYALATAS